MVKPLMENPPSPEKKKNGRVTIIRQYELLTPLFGGGVKANVVDVDNPIRGTAVRGHLRFWWRATRGLQFAGNWEKLKAKEDKIWGSTKSRSKIVITVIESECRNMTNVNNLGEKLRYAAFPLIEANGNVYKDVTFTLRIDCPKEYRPELKAALWAWETFGGIGARTRRGFGALHCTDVDLWIDDKKYKSTNWEWTYSCQNAAMEIVADVNKLTTAEVPPDSKLPGLSRDIRCTHCTPAQNDRVDAWRHLIASLKKFRQSRTGFGRSHWPDPDAIRKLTGQSLKSKSHDVPVHNSPPIDEKFPRTAFGLPIIFEFHHAQRNPPGGTDSDKDPFKTELKPTNHKRRASRLILRPLKCKDGHYVGLATILQGKIIPDGGLELRNSPANPVAGAEKLDPLLEASQIQAEHPHYNGDTDILQAFLDQLP